MKTFFKLVLGILLLLLVWKLYGFFKPTNSDDEVLVSPKSKVLFEEENIDLSEIEVEGVKYRYKVYKVEENENLDLMPNFEEKEKSTEIVEEEKCKFLVSGGFYTKDEKPLGYFKTKEKLIRNKSANSLIDGYLYKKSDEEIGIGFNLTGTDNLIWGIQSGPMLIKDGELMNLKIREDKEARRVFAASNKKGELFFGVVVSEESLSLGSMLADLPQIVEKISEDGKYGFVDAINMDGGSASAYVNSEVEIVETNYIGSYFCER